MHWATKVLNISVAIFLIAVSGDMIAHIVKKG